MNTYKRLPLNFTKGKGVWLYDKIGKKYLDFLSGVAVNSLGYNHPLIIKAIQSSLQKTLHVSNYFIIEVQEKLAEKLCKLTGDNYKAFFCNSGTEAMEATLKLARKKTGKKKLISFTNSFHGRTFGSLSVTAKEIIKTDFKPLLSNCQILKFNNEKDLDKINNQTAAVIFEFIQGEGGVNIAEKKWIQKLFSKCQKVGALTIADEVQTGISRTGTFFAFEQYGVFPDIISLAKGLGGGVPIGAILAKDEISNAFNLGTHGSTFGGNPFVCSVANAVVKKVSSQKFLNSINENSKYFLQKLRIIQRNFNKIIKDVRGVGLMIGIEFYNKENAQKTFDTLLNHHKIITNITAGKTLRLLPPLIAEKKHFDFFYEKLKQCLIEIC